MNFLRKLSDGEIERAYETVFREAFPPEELKPLAAMRRMMGEGQYEPLGLFRDGEPVGYICCWLDEPYILIDYLCVDRRFRNRGIGAVILEKTREYYPENTVFIGEVEAPTGDGEADGLIRRRLGFYARCGARTLSYDTAAFGVHYKTIAWAAGELDEAEVMARHDGFYRRNFPPERYAAAIQIPLRPGEKPFRRTAWDERPDTQTESEEKAL